MTIAFWAVLAAIFLPIVLAWVGKVGGKSFDNAAPRDWIARQTGWRQRADWAQRNHYEVFPPFVAAVVIAHLAHAPQGYVDALAVAFVLIRIAYAAAYVLDRPTLRSALWSAGYVCVIGLFAVAA